MTATLTRQNVLEVMDETGHSKHIWNPENADEVSAMKTMFKSLKSKGYLAYSVKDNGDQGVAITEFDPMAGKVILTPPLRGG